MAKKRPSIPSDIKRLLFIECGYKCSMPRCEHQIGLQIHHINDDPSNNDLENLIVFCSVHHSLATNNTIDRKFCKQLKQILLDSSIKPIQKPYKETIHTRLQFLNKAIELIKEKPTSYRSTKIGPLFLHPSWWGIRRNNNIQSPDYEKEVYNYILSNCESRNHDIRIVFRNVPRYKEKVERFVSKSERSKFIDDVLDAVDRVWGEKGTKGPDICCVDTGFFNTEVIFHAAMIVCNRVGPNAPITGGYGYIDITEVEAERARFDSVFDTCSRGQQTELSELRRYIKELW